MMGFDLQTILDGLRGTNSTTIPTPGGVPNSSIPRPGGAPNLGMGQMPYIPAAANPPQNPGKYMSQAMQLSGVPGLLAQQQQQAGPPTGYMPRELLQWLQLVGGTNAGAPRSVSGLPFNLGMGGTPYR